MSGTSIMKMALDISHNSVGISKPNPPVGAVIVKDGEII